ncbi:MAG: hypothetical protein M1819_004492 [Sarea resinae]|nr:MAG: hypothetical protein M1819_004492 [Sarea resinae]
MTNNSVAANVLGTIGTTVGVSRIWSNYRRKNTEGLPGAMLFLWSICAVPFGVYAVVQKFNIPMQVQPQVFCALSLVSWAQTLVYHSHKTPMVATLIAVVTGLVFAGVETLLILTLRGPYNRGTTWPITFIGVIAAVLLAAGLIPPYFEIWKRKGRVVGINLLFLTVDFSGAFFSLIALAVQNHFDVLGGILYIICLFLELGIFISHWVWLLRTRKVRKEAKCAGLSYDEYVEKESADCPSGSGLADSKKATPSSSQKSSPSSSDLELGNSGVQKADKDTEKETG